MAFAINCTDTHPLKSLSVTTLGVSSFLLLSTSVLNLLILVAFVTKQKSFKRSIFYKILLNIVLADLCTGLISDSMSIYFHLKEVLTKDITSSDITLVHFTLFLFNNVSNLTMSLLCFDRVYALLRPLTYRKCIHNWRVNFVLLLTWVLSAILVVPYFYIGFVLYLQIFCCVTVLLTFVILVITTIVYQRKLTTHTESLSLFKKFPVLHNCCFRRTVKSKVEKTDSTSSTKRVINHSDFNSSNSRMRKRSMSSIRKEKRVNASFFMMLLVFLLTYAPAAVMTVYINVCQDCSCSVIHILRDVIFTSILASALWRSLNFVLRLMTLRRAIREMLGLNVKKTWLRSMSTSSMNMNSNIRLESCKYIAS